MNINTRRIISSNSAKFYWIFEFVLEWWWWCVIIWELEWSQHSTCEKNWISQIIFNWSKFLIILAPFYKQLLALSLSFACHFRSSLPNFRRLQVPDPMKIRNKEEMRLFFGDFIRYTIYYMGQNENSREPKI